MDEDIFIQNHHLLGGNLYFTTTTPNDPPLYLPQADPTVWNQPCTVSPDGDELDLFDDDEGYEDSFTEEDYPGLDEPGCDCEVCSRPVP